MIKNIFTHWRTTAPGVLAIVTGVVTFISLVIDHTLTAPVAITLIMGICTGIGLLYSQDYAQGEKAHAQSQAQIAELQLRSNLTPNSIDSGDTSLLRNVPMTPAAVPPPPIPVVPPTTNTK